MSRTFPNFVILNYRDKPTQKSFRKIRLKKEERGKLLLCRSADNSTRHARVSNYGHANRKLNKSGRNMTFFSSLDFDL